MAGVSGGRVTNDGREAHEVGTGRGDITDSSSSGEWADGGGGGGGGTTLDFRMNWPEESLGGRLLTELDIELVA